MPAELQKTLNFLMDLRANNSREWFEDNKKRYEESRAIVETLLADIIQKFGKTEDLGDVEPKDCIFRIYRDVRFSKDKTPYKTNIGCVIGAEGRKSEGRSYYLHIEPLDESAVGAGAWNPSPEQLKAIRLNIAENPKALEKIVGAKNFKTFFKTLAGDRVKTSPKGFDASHPAIEFLKYKQFMGWTNFSDEELLKDDFADQVVERFKALIPLETYLQSIYAKMR